MAETLVFRLQRRQKASIDALTLDASVNETHDTDVDVTDFPVEQGANISDHRRRKPRTITVEGVVSNTPLPDDGDPMNTVTSNGFTWNSRSSADATRASTAYNTLLDLADASRLLTVVTSLQKYENMTITKLSVPRNASIGQALRFTATLREIRVVRNDTVTINAKTTRAKPKVDQHKKPTAPVDDRSRYLKFMETINSAGAGATPTERYYNAITHVLD